MKILDVTQSGSTAGTTSSRNRFGQYRRRRAVPVQPRTPRQTQNRGLLTAGSSSWRTLTDAQRDAWVTYADQLQRSDSLGTSYRPTGAQVYTGSFIAAQGVALTNPPVDLPDYVLLIAGMAYTDPTPGPEALTVDIAITSADNRFICESSGNVSPGITSAAAVRRWRSLPVSAGSTYPNLFAMTSTPVSLLTSYKVLFPSPPTGSNIWFRFREIAFPGGATAPITNRLWQTYRLTIP